MTARTRVVIDTNALVSRLLPGSVPSQAVQKALREADLLMSEATLNELADVLARSKFDPYVNIEERQEFIRMLGRIVDMVPVVYRVHECRDPRDNRFLEVAVNGEANLVVSGDNDLLVLHPYRDIKIVTPAAFLEIGS